MQTTIRNAWFEVTADTRGAELTSVRYKGKERLWQNEDGSWQGHAPVLFPVCGVCAMRVGGWEYPCPKHGFAREREFLLAEKTADTLRFRLTNDAVTETVYPFAFVFEVAYTLSEACLTTTYTVRNPAESSLYFSCGGHDSFTLDREVKNYELLFEKEEVFRHHLVDERTGKLTGESVPLGAGQVLDLATPYLDGGGSVCLDRLRSRSVLLQDKETGCRVARVTFHGTEKLVLWHPAGAKMLCIEPWQTLPDKAGDDSEFSEKDGVLCVPPHGERQITRVLQYD